jgi:hypothetical protein
MADMAPKVVGLQHSPRFKNGTVEYTTLLTFKVGELGPFTHAFDKGDVTAAEINQYMAQFAAQLQQLNGLE